MVRSMLWRASRELARPEAKGVSRWMCTGCLPGPQHCASFLAFLSLTMPICNPDAHDCRETGHEPCSHQGLAKSANKVRCVSKYNSDPKAGGQALCSLYLGRVSVWSSPLPHTDTRNFGSISVPDPLSNSLHLLVPKTVLPIISSSTLHPHLLPL